MTTTLWKLGINVILFWNDYKILMMVYQPLILYHNICKYVRAKREARTLRLGVSCSTD